MSNHKPRHWLGPPFTYRASDNKIWCVDREGKPAVFLDCYGFGWSRDLLMERLTGYDELLEALEKVEGGLGFHEGSAERKTPDGHPVVRVNEEDLNEMLSTVRAVLAKAKGEE